MSQNDLVPSYYEATDGTRLAYYEMGEGLPVILMHGLFSNGWTTWVRYGHAERIVKAGFKLILPDLRGHGRSGAPHDPEFWPADVLASDIEALIAHLNLGTDFILGGYSLGARTSARILARGMRPRGAILGGMGLDGLVNTAGRGVYFRKVLLGWGTHSRGSNEFLAEAFLKTTGGDPKAMLPLLDTFVDTPRDVIETFDLPTLVICGVEDQDNGSTTELVELLPQGTLTEIRGTHMGAVLLADLGNGVVDFLTKF